uniref:ABC transmembrane type-1 domain-containing protein n=1 Tax=uncultured prokaryote TaxID=198431 RepID=A0A0H5PZ84_9ZZZZ|nr:hypothetical protein [uncultured prokaryote]
MSTEMSTDKKQSKKSVTLRILSYIRPHWYLILISTIAGVVKLTVPLVLPQVVKYFTDEVLVAANWTAQQKIEEIVKWLFILLFLYIVIYIPATYFRESGTIEVSNRIMHTLRKQVYSYLQKMSAAFHHENKSGNLVTRISSDVQMVHEFVWDVATNVWIDSICLIVYVYLLGTISIPLTIVACTTLPLSVLITKKIREYIRAQSKKVQNNISEISGYMQERMAGFATVKLFNMEEYERNKYNHYSELIYKYTQKRNRMYASGEAITGSMSEVICSIIVCVSAIYIVQGTMSVGDLIVFYSYLGYFMTPLRRFARITVTYSRSIAGIEALFIAYILNFKIKGVKFFRTAYYIPSILGGSVAIAVLWKAIFKDDGLLNTLLAMFGVDGPSWLSDPSWALFVICLLRVWQFGSAMVIFLAALKGVPVELYEAATVDGAGKWKQFFSITVPMITPIIFYNLVTQICQAFQEFNGPYIITQGGPRNSTTLISLLIYNSAFKNYEMGMASAMAWVLFVILMIFTVIAFLSQKYWVYYSDEEGR